MNSFSTTLRTLLGIALPWALAGCLSMPNSPDSAANHPASTNAAVSPVPPWQPALLTVTNVVPVKPVTSPASEHQDGHEAHEAKPKPEEKK